jgi:hypothetical protein
MNTNNTTFKTTLESLDRGILMWVARYNLNELTMVDLLLEQNDDYPDYLFNLTGEERDEEPIMLYPEVRSLLETIEEEELFGLFGAFVWSGAVIDELMSLDEEAREEVLENVKTR